MKDHAACRYEFIADVAADIRTALDKLMPPARAQIPLINGCVAANAATAESTNKRKKDILSEVTGALAFLLASSHKSKDSLSLFLKLPRCSHGYLNLPPQS